MPVANSVDVFWSRVDKSDGPTACWPWRGNVYHRRGGYGYFSLHCKVWKAHRLAFALAKEDPSGLHVLHKCDNPVCCNPDHLFLGSDADNMADKVRKGRQNRGDTSPVAKLTSSQVGEIKRRLSAGEKPAQIAPAYGVSKWAIYTIAQGRNWAHVG